MFNNKIYFTCFYKYPLVRQLDKSDCGPAALLSVLKYFGGEASLWHIRSLCRTGLHGTTLYDMIEAAKSLGLSASGVKGSYEDLMSGKLPAIAHVHIDKHREHFIVIYQIRKKYLIAVDPARGRIKLERDMFEQMWRSKVLILFDSSDQPVCHASFSWYSWLLRNLKNESAWMGQSIFLGLIFTLLGLLTAFFIQQLIDRYIPSGQSNKILYTGSLLLFLLFIRACTGYIRERFLIVLNRSFSTRVNADFIRHLFRMPKRFFDSWRKGDITARIHDIIKIQQFINRLSSSTIIDLMIILGSISVIFFYSAEIGLIILIFLPLYGLLLILHMQPLKNEQREVMQSFARVESIYIDSLSGIDTILSYHAADSFSKLNKLIFGYFQEKIVKLGTIRNRLTLFTEISAALISVFTLIRGALDVGEGSLLLGEMIAAYSLLSYLIPSISRSVEVIITFQGAMIAIRRLFELLLVEKETAKGNHCFEMKKAVKLEKIKFNWAANKVLLRGIDLIIPRGKLISLWGPSGAGKSTLAQIIQRKYEPDSGRIMLDGRNAMNIELKDYRKHIALVPQDISVFHGTLAENILLGRSISGTDLNDFFPRYGLESFLNRFENGLYTLIGEEFRQLSAGEKQVLGLIRALVSLPSLIMVDEGFNALDIKSENLIFSILKKYAQLNAVLIITHNIKIILKTDYVYALDSGMIVQKGIPSEIQNEAGVFNSVFEKEWLRSFHFSRQQSIKQRGNNGEILPQKV